tara:strand:- start:2715 stop:5459 length:2745 start_codon:yes stop_codon:yes gene_type:complete
MDIDTREIGSITFGIYSTKEIIDMSVCKLENPKKSGYGSVYDERMGPTDSSKKCETCGENAQNCNGHFGHIEFNEPIINPLHYRRVVSFLNCVCYKCNRLLLLKDQIYLSGINKSKGESRFTKIQEKVKKIDMCCHENCGYDQPTYKFCTTDSSIHRVYESKDKQKTSVVLTTEEILKTFTNIPDSDIELMGFDPTIVHPRNLIIEVLPVLPTCARPYVKADGNMCDDDLTNQYIEIIKTNNHLDTTKEDSKKELSEVKRQKFLATLKFRVLTTFNNGQGKAKHTTNGRAIKGIKERLAGKEGQIRTNLMGKRCNQTGRTVIGPDPTLKLGELGVPYEMAQTLTFPERVTLFNIKKLQDLVNEGKVDSILKPDGVTRINLKRFRRGSRLVNGDIIIRGIERISVVSGRELVLEGDKIERNGEILDNIIPSDRNYTITEGWIVERQLQDGDYVLLNRQPTLHKASMMAMQIVLKPYKTLRMNLAITKPFNADFDGDEMNIHAPQSIEAMAELKMLSAAQWNLISAQSSKPNMAIVQDSLLGAYRMTLGEQKITKSQFFNISEKLDLEDSFTDRVDHIRSVLKEKGKKTNVFTGKGLISLFLPKDLFYEKKNDANAEEPYIRIYKGVLYEGTLDKSILGSSYNSLIQIIHKEYSATKAAHFIDCIQFVTNEWNLIKLFTVGLGDCLVSSSDKQEEINDVIKKCYIEAEGIKTTTNHDGIREMRVNAVLGKAKDIGLRIAKDSFSKDNNFLSTVKSGSKGDFFNIAQITGLLGQQNLKGSRIPLYLNNGRRSLPHYPFENLSPEMEYESRGFISSSFINGLNPREFYFHAMSGREGISDTAMGTATSGYMQRRIVKLTEDIKIHNDGTVRDVIGHIYQIVYGENGLDPTCTVKVNGEQEFCDIFRMVTKLNMEEEDK